MKTFNRNKLLKTITDAIGDHVPVFYASGFRNTEELHDQYISRDETTTNNEKIKPLILFL